MRIDAHQHFWDPARGDYGWLTPADVALHRRFGPEDLAPLIEAAGIDGTILIQAAPTETETSYLLDLAEASPSVLGVVGWVDFDAVDAVGRIAARAAIPRLVGLRPMLQDLDDPDWILAPSRAPVLEAMAAHGLVFDALIRADQLEVVLTLAARHPDLSIVIDHAAKPAIAQRIDPDWAEAITQVGGRANIACKLSGLMTQAEPGAGADSLRPCMDILLAAFGPGRLLFGSDWPVLTQATSYARWLDLVADWLAPLGAAVEAAVMGLNAQRLYLSTDRP